MKSGFLALLLAGLLTPAAERLQESADTVRWMLSYAGRVSGRLERWTEPDGRLGFLLEYNDRGRGPRTVTRLRLDGRGWPVEIQSEGHDYWKNPVAVHYQAPDDRVVDGYRAGGLDSWTWLPVLAGAIRTAPGGSVPVVQGDSGGTVPATMREAHRLRVRSDAGREQEVTLVAIAFGPSVRGRIWLDQAGDLFGVVGFQSLVRQGWQAALPALIEAEEHLAGLRMAESAGTLLRRPAERVAITGVRLVDVRTGSVTAGSTILSRGSEIEAVGPDGLVELPGGTHVVDGTGKFALPGLWEMHAHLGSANDAYARSRLAQGILAARDLVGTLPSVHSIHRRRRAVESGREIGLRMVLSGFIDGPAENTGPTSVLVETEDSARSAVRSYARMGYNQIKIYSSLKPSLVPAIIDEARRHGLRVSGHIPAFMTAEQAVRVGLDEINHANHLVLTFFGDTIDTRGTDRFYIPAEHAASLDLESDRVRSFIRLLRERNVVVDPTLCIFRNQWRNDDGMPVRVGSTRDQYRRSYQRMQDLVVTMHRAGVRIVAGTDNACSVQDELAIYAEAGIPIPALLRMATLTAAEVTGRADRLGTIEPGKLADYILLEADPTADIGNLRRVALIVTDGIPLTPADLRGSTDWP